MNNEMTDLAAALLKDVPRYTCLSAYGPPDQFMEEADVLAALSAHLDADLAEQTGEVLEALQKADEYEPLGHDGWDAADLITALLAQNAALRAERDGLQQWAENWRQSAKKCLAHAEKQEARAEAAEAKVEKLVEAAEGLSAILDKNETKGPLPDTVLMFCWLAAQNVRAVLRGYMLENPE